MSYGIENKDYYCYAVDVVNGKIHTSEYTQLACKRYLSDLQREDLIFKYKRVDRVIKFISVLKHYTGKSSGKNFKTEGWQSFIIANLFGFFYKDTGIRRYQSAYIECARKQGKTALAAALCLYLLIADGEDGAEVLLAANSKEQAKIAFDMASQFAKQLDSDNVIKAYRNEVKFFPTNSKMKVLSSDDSKLDGFNASAAIIDEYHAAKNSKVKDVIASSMGMRTQPLMLTITTAGFDKTLPCYQLRTTATEILRGLKRDDSQFILIYTLDDDDDWTDKRLWAKSNPNLGVTVTEEYIKSQVIKALNNPNEESGIRTKLLNQWLDSKTQSWLPASKVMAQMKKIELDDFDKEIPLYIGVDLGSVSDLTAISVMQLNEEYRFKNYYFLPSMQLQDNPNSEKYKEWNQQDKLIVNDGNVTDYDYIAEFLKRLSEKFNIQGIYYDKWNATQWAIKCTEYGLPLYEYSQSIGNFTAPTKEFERLILNKELFIDDNPINLFCIKNCIIKEDWNENRKIVKNSYQNKIDGAVAMITALGGFLKTPHYSNTIITL